MTTNRIRYDAGAPHAPAVADAWAGAISDDVDALNAGGNGHAPDPALEDDGQSLFTATGDYLFLPGVTWLEEGEDDSHIPAGTLIIEVEAPPELDVAPANLTAIAASDEQINLSWGAVDGASGYEYRVDGGIPVDVFNNLSAEVTGLTADTEYSFEVRAYNAQGPGPWSAPVSETTQAEASAPDAPTGLSATGGDGQVALAWTASADATGHRVYRHTADSFGAASQIGADLAFDADSYLDEAVTNDTEYFYWVTAFNAVGESDPSTVASATPAEVAGFSTDFTEYAIDEDLLSSDWANRGGQPLDYFEVQANADTPGGRQAQVRGAGSGSHVLLAWTTPPGTESDFNVLALIRRSELGGEVLMGAAARIREDATWRAYGAGWRNDTTDGTLRAPVPGGSSGGIADASTALDPFEWNWVRLDVQGTTVRMRLWANDPIAADNGVGDEPGTWLISETNSLVEGAGEVGFWFHPDGSELTRASFGYLSVAFGGDIAPGPS